MIMKSDMAISLAGVAFTDELHNSLGAAALSLRDTVEDSGHDFFRSLTINTAAGGAGTALIETVDYTVSEESVTETTSTGEKLGLTDRVSQYLGSAVHVYHKVQIINAIYQACDLYFSGYYHGDLPSATRLNKEKDRYYSLSASATISSSYGCGVVFCNGGANGFRLTLNFEKGQKVRFTRTDSNNSAVTLLPASGNILRGTGNYFFLIDQYQSVDYYFDGTNYYPIGGKLICSSGWVNTNDWTNVELGTVDCDFDTEVNTLVVGEMVTQSVDGNTGIIVKKTATTLTLWKCSGTGVFTNNRTLTGSFGTATALVNEPGTGSTKALDCNLYHGSGLTKEDFTKVFSVYAGTTGQDAASVEIGNFTLDGAPAAQYKGFGFIGVDANNIKLQTGETSMHMITEAGQNISLTNPDYAYKIKMIHTY